MGFIYVGVFIYVYSVLLSKIRFLEWVVNSEKNNKVRGITLPDIKAYYVDTIINTVQQNREPRIDLHKYAQLIFYKSGEII